MAGFDEFINILKETNKTRVSSMNGLNGIIEKINEAKKLQYEAESKALAEEFPNSVPLSAEEQKTEDLKKRRLDSNNIIMSNSSKKMETADGIGEATQTLNSNEIFPLSFTSENVVQGFIFSEVLGMPRCKRRRAR